MSKFLYWLMKTVFFFFDKGSLKGRHSRGYDSVIRRMKSFVCVSIDSVCVLVLSILNWKGKDGNVRVGLIILYKFSAKCRLLLCRSFQMISTLNDANNTYIKPMIEACREGMHFIVYKYNTCIQFALSFMVLSIIMTHVLL